LASLVKVSPLGPSVPSAAKISVSAATVVIEPFQVPDDAPLVVLVASTIDGVAALYRPETATIVMAREVRVE
jgi:hypothetical protein